MLASVTPESPPQIGGVADFTRVMATALAARGHQVHVWSPAPAEAIPSVAVHPLPGGYAAGRLGILSRALDAVGGPRRLFVQWVPHGYGYKSLNVAFCLWLWRRARRGDVVDLMVHEPFLPFASGRPRQNIGAIAHRLMLMVLLRAAGRVWVSTPSFLPMVRPFGPRRAAPYAWLPIPSPVSITAHAVEVSVRRRTLAGTRPTVGYFGTANPLVAGVLERVIVGIAGRRPDVRFVLLGRGTEQLAQRAGDAHTRPRPGNRGEWQSAGRRTVDLDSVLRCVRAAISRRRQCSPHDPDGAARARSRDRGLTGARTEDGWDQAIQLTREGDAMAMVASAVGLLEAPLRRAALSEAASRLYAERFHVDRAINVLLNTPDV